MSQLSILLVDDDMGDRKQVRRLLSRASLDHQVHEAEDVDRAKAFRGAAPDLIFLDHMLPGLTGLDALELLTEQWPKAAVVLMTGQGSEDIAKSAILKGAIDYVPKTELSAALMRRIAQSSVDIARNRWRAREYRRNLESFCEVLVHDFRAPVRSAAFLADQILEDLDEGNTEDMRVSAELLKRTTSQMSALVNSLASHIHTGRNSAPIDTAPIANVIDTALIALQRDIETSNAAIEVEVVDRLVTCDLAALSQVLQNLVANAIKYAGARQPRIQMRAADKEGGFQISVSDNGIGIPTEYAHLIFDPFTRLPGAKAVSGTGLGLATCRNVVERFGGRIWCAPNPDIGTTFFIHLPSPILATVHRNETVMAPCRVRGSDLSLG